MTYQSRKKRHIVGVTVDGVRIPVCCWAKQSAATAEFTLGLLSEITLEELVREVLRNRSGLASRVRASIE